MADLNRIVTLIDMDCFYCQVEEKLDPTLKGNPIAVVQYNEWKGGGIIAVNYVARAKGVTRHMRGDEAREKCPDIKLARVPCVRGKADISKYRDAGKDVAHVLQSFTTLLERASIDEAYLDITENVNLRIAEFRDSKKIDLSLLFSNYVLGYNDISKFIADCYTNDNFDNEMSGFDQEHSLRLLVGGVIVSEIRSAVYESTGFTCSAGIANNKIMAKLVCGMNKPNKQTILPKSSIPSMFESLPVNQVKGLGGKFGISVCEQLNITKISELAQYSEKDLQKHFDDKNGTWLYYIARGIDMDPVTPRFSSKSIGCCKKFAGKNAIVNYASLLHWLSQLGEEIEDRLKADSLENNRQPTQMVVSFTKQLTNGKDVSCSRSLNLQTTDGYCGKTLAENSLQLIKKDSKPFFAADIQNQNPQANEEVIILAHPIKYLGISVGKFEDTNENRKINIQNFFVQKKTENPNQNNILVKRDEQNFPVHLASTEIISCISDESKKAINSFASQSTSRDNSLDDKAVSKVVHKNDPTKKDSPLLNYFKNHETFNRLSDNVESESNNFINADVSEKKLATENSECVLANKQSPQESFFLRYFKKVETPQPKGEVTRKLPNMLPVEDKVELDDLCSSDDSQCTIELEINRSHQLNIQTTTCCVPRTTPKYNLFSPRRSPDESHCDVPLLSCKENDGSKRMVLCTKCNNNVPENELQTHIDYHFALSLREEERISNRNAQNIKQTSMSQPKLKSSKPIPSKNSIASIFNKINDKINSEIESNDHSLSEHCPECGKNIKQSAFAEHLNYHEAKKIHLEINKPSLAQSASTTHNHAKRKKVIKESLNNKKKNIQPISTFFQ